MENKELQQKLFQINSSIKTDYEKMLPLWKDISKYSMSYRGRFPDEEPYIHLTRADEIISSALNDAGNIVAAGLQSGLTNQSSKWFKFSLEDKDLMKYKPAREWMYDCEMVIYSILNRSNFYKITPSVYKEMVYFGNASVLQERSYKNVTRFCCLTCGEYMFGQNEELEIDCHFRTFRYTLGQLVSKFGLENLPIVLQGSFKNGNVNQQQTVVHAIIPNYYRDNTKIDNKNMPFLSVYYLKNIENGYILSTSGYKQFPFHTPRWETVSTDLYGIAPAFNALNTCAAIQKVAGMRLLGIEYQANPPWNIPKTLAENGDMANLLPGGSTIYDPNLPETKVTPSFNINFDINGANLVLAEMKESIDRQMFSDIFKMIANTDKNMTASEVLERREEKMVLLGPVLNNIHNGFLEPVIMRSMEHAGLAGLLPPPPPDLVGKDLGVEFISMLAQAQKFTDVKAAVEFSRVVGQVAEVINPEARLKFDSNTFLDYYAEHRGINPHIVRSNGEVSKIIETENQARQQEQQMAIAKQALDGARTLSEVKRNTQ